MKIVKDEGVYKASRIAGPKHNFLGLGITGVSPPDVQCIQRTLRDDGASQINEEQLLAAVSEGVSVANRELGASLFVERIEYVPTDTPEYNTYQELAKAIILSAAKDFN
ncbi:MAG: hypothetical protein V4719_05230 [Planctomycetota bacterium]